MRIRGGSEFARMLMLQRQAVETRERLDTAGRELTTLQRASRFEASGGNLTRLFALERSIDRTDMFRETISLTALRLEVMQDAIGAMGARATTLSVELGAATRRGDHAAAMGQAASARGAFLAAAGLLNTQVAGQALFAGTETDGAALIDPEALLADITAAASGAPNAAGLLAAIDTYFAETPPGRFYTHAYAGADDTLTPVDIGEGERLDYGLRADAAPFAALLRAHAIAAVVAGGALSGDPGAQDAALEVAGTRMLAAKEEILALGAHVGTQQERVETAQAARVAERETLTLARTRLLAVDDLEAASRFQQLETQLQTIFNVTARLASLRFANFMP